MNYALIGLSLGTGLFFGMLIFSEVGRRIGIARLTRDPEGLDKGTGAAEAAVFGLMGLLIAFTFSGAASRFEDRRHLVNSEANAIGTAYLRLDLLPNDSQPELRELFRGYVDVRSVTYLGQDLDAMRLKHAEGSALQEEIRTKATAACQRQDAPTQAAMLLLPALNEMIDITTTRVSAAQNHPPLVIFLLLAGLSLIGALMIGYDTSSNKDRSWFHIIVFAAIMSLAVYVIIDLEFPRFGLIRIDAADQLLVELRKSMH
jgi:hypothetical protein